MKKKQIILTVGLIFVFGIFFQATAQNPAKKPTVPTDVEIEAQRQKYLDMLRRKQQDIQQQIDFLEGKPGAVMPVVMGAPAGGDGAPAGGGAAPAGGGAAPAGGEPPASKEPCEIYAPDDKDHQVEVSACDIATLIVKNKKNRIGDRLNSIQGDLETIFREKRYKKTQADLEALAVERVKNQEKDLVVNSERMRTDKQVGAGASASGSTSLVVRGGGPAIFGFAVENGAVTSSVDGTNVTVRVNPYNAARAFLFSRDLPEIRSFAGNAINMAFTKTGDGDKTGFFDIKKLYLGFTFDTTRGRETPQFVISKQQLSAWSARYEFINHRNPLAPEWDALRNQYFKNQAIPGDAIVNATTALFKLPSVKKAVQKVFAEIDEILRADDAACAKDLSGVANLIAHNNCVQKAYNAVMSKVDDFSLADFEKEKPIADLFKTLDDNTDLYRKNREDFLAEVNKGAIATLEYTNHREVNAPDWSNVRFIWEKGLLGGFNFTANAEMSFYNKKPTIAGTRRIRDFDFALDLERKLNDILPFGNSTLSGALRYTRQQGDVVLPNGVVASGTKGDIMFGQLKLTIPLGDTGLKIPVSMTFGNRSEFIKERFTRVNFGLTLDADQLFRPFGIFK